MSWFARFMWMLLDVVHFFVTMFVLAKDTVDDVLHRYKFQEGDWLHAENTVVKVMEVGWKTYDLRVYCKHGLFRYSAHQKMAERAYKKVDKDHFKAIATIYDR